MRDLAERAAADKARGAIEEGRWALLKTRKAVVDGWHAVGERLRADGHHGLAEYINGFIDRMPPVKTDREAILEGSRSPFQPPNREQPARTR
jgi:hypothetical protein